MIISDNSILRIKKIIFYLIIITNFNILKSESFRAFETTYNLNELKVNLEKVLNKIDKGHYKQKTQTDGFNFHYVNKISSPYEYDIYISKIFANKDKTILRVEGASGDALVISRILDLENVIKKDSSLFGTSQVYKPDYKYHILAQGINIFSPALSIIYQSKNSPMLSKNQALIRGFVYLGLDILAIWIGGNNFFRTSIQLEENKSLIAVWLLTNRIAGMGQAINVIRGHNNIVQFGYTFPIE